MIILNQMPEIVGTISWHRPGYYSNKRYDRNEILSKAQGQWPYILAKLGIDRAYLINKHGPCPMCGGNDRFRFDDKGLGRYICNQCGSGDGVKLLIQCFAWDFPEALANIAQALDFQNIIYSNHASHVSKNVTNTQVFVERRQRYINNLYANSLPISHEDPVSKYLCSRNIFLENYPNSLRYYRDLGYYEDGKLVKHYDAMLGLVRNCDNKVVSIHRTYLENGIKADVSSPKKLTSSVFSGALKGTAIKLFEPTDGSLAVAEGIETALSFYILSGIPTWATINACGMQNIILPNNVKNVVIVADNDSSFVGQNAAIALSRRLLAEGRKVKRITPEHKDTDFNDVLMGVKHD
jgi:putative DNA primase/helicase